MPLKLTVGRSAKESHNYNSKGYSINLDVELPANVLGDPQQIRESAERLFGMCDNILEAQMTGDGSQRSEHKSSTPSRQRTNGRNGGNGYTRGRGNHQEQRGLTNAQERAINNMVRRLDRDADDWVHHEFGVDGVKNLSVKQASQFIDVLKQEIETPAGAGR